MLEYSYGLVSCFAKDGGKMYRILIADEESTERDTVIKLLQKNFSRQLEVVTAADGREAVALYEEKACKIALLDIKLPGIDGLEAAGQIRSRNPGAVIIFVTECREFSYAKRAITIRALEYLLKPAAEEEVVSILEEALGILKAEQKKRLSKPEWEKGIRYTGNVKLDAVAEKIYEYIKVNYKEDISLQDVAGHMNYSDAYFCKIFKQCFEKSFLVYLTEYRVERAKELLEDISINIKDVSYKVGYRDSNYFAKVFKRIVGITPTEYRMEILQ